MHLFLYTHIHSISGWGLRRISTDGFIGTFERHGSRCTRRLSRRGSGISSGFSQPFPSGSQCEPTTAAVGPATVPPRRRPGICRFGGGVKYFLEFSPRKLGKMNPFWLIFFRWVETTNFRSCANYVTITSMILVGDGPAASDTASAPAGADHGGELSNKDLTFCLQKSVKIRRICWWTCMKIPWYTIKQYQLMIGNMTYPTFGTIWFFRFTYIFHQQDVVEETRPPNRWVPQGAGGTGRPPMVLCSERLNFLSHFGVWEPTGGEAIGGTIGW